MGTFSKVLLRLPTIILVDPNDTAMSVDEVDRTANTVVLFGYVCVSFAHNVTPLPFDCYSSFVFTIAAANILCSLSSICKFYLFPAF
jgi:hypothetical protein